MNSSVRIALPILLAMGLVFGITFISQNTTSPPAVPTQHSGSGNTNPFRPILFGVTAAERNPKVPHLRNMQMDWEVGAEGHFDFWFHNPNQKPMEVYLKGKSCTCAGAQFAVFRPEVIRNFLTYSFLGSLAPGGVPGGFLPIAGLQLVQPEFVPMSMESEEDRKIVPASTEELPQLGIIRVTFSGKNPTEKERYIHAEVIAQLPNSTKVPITLSVKNRVLPSINLFFPDATGSGFLSLGEILPNQRAEKAIVCFSTTRPELDLNIEVAKNQEEPTFSYSRPIPLNEEELQWLTQSVAEGTPFGASVIRCAYRIMVSASERKETEVNGKKEIHRMEMGPFDKYLTISVGDRSQNNSQKVMVRGLIRSEVSIISSNNDRDRVDFGRTMNSKSGARMAVEVISMRAGLDVELVKDAQVPSYLETELTLKSNENGLKKWTLSVRVPPDKLYGSFPEGSAIYLQTKDADKRRIRVPIIGQSTDTRPF